MNCAVITRSCVRPNALLTVKTRRHLTVDHEVLLHRSRAFPVLTVGKNTLAMATTVSMARLPFGELSNSRVQQLNSAKNRQNGMSDRIRFHPYQHGILTTPGFLAKSSPLSGKPLTASSPAKTTGKRAFSPTYDDDADSENADPSLFSPFKKSKSDSCEKPFTFTMKTPVKSMPPPPLLPARTPARANTSSPRAPLTAPAGRSPPRKHAGISKTRRVSAPFTRVDPPFSSRGSSSLPFSLDAAISGSMSAVSTPTKDKSAGSTIQESVPSSWEFEIYEDTPEEEAANLMEHSTQTLDLSFDDETTKAQRDCRGKENEAPEGYDAPTASRLASSANEPTPPSPTRVKKTEFIRRKITEMDDGERSPLSDLETDEFIPQGLEKDSHVIIDASPEKTKLNINDLFATSPPEFALEATKTESKKSSHISISSITTSDADAGENVVIWEDGVDGVNDENVENTTKAEKDEPVVEKTTSSEVEVGTT